MDTNSLKELLESVAGGDVSAAAAMEILGREGGFVDLGHTRLDTDRKRRRGVSEAVYCEGKSAGQIVEISRALDERGFNVLCTRVSEEQAAEVLRAEAGLTHAQQARMLYKVNEPPRRGAGTVAVVTGGTTDIPVAEEAALCLEIWGEDVDRIYDVGVAGLHRVMAVVERLQKASVIVTIAGMEAALASVVAGLVACPVVAVPTSVGYGTGAGGLSALMGMLNACSGGIGTVNIDNGFGGALLAHMINRVGAEDAPGETDGEGDVS